MNNIYVFSGPCGCGKTTLTNAFARHLVSAGGRLQAYVIHGDDFHQGFVDTDHRDAASPGVFLNWPDILKFNWDCILSVAGKALDRKLDVVIDYIVEDELPLLIDLAKRFGAQLYYVVLTISEEELVQRLTLRGSEELIERSLFLKNQLDHAPESQNHLYDISAKTPDQEIAGLNIDQYRLLS